MSDLETRLASYELSDVRFEQLYKDPVFCLAVLFRHPDAHQRMRAGHFLLHGPQNQNWRQTDALFPEITCLVAKALMTEPDPSVSSELISLIELQPNTLPQVTTALLDVLQSNRDSQLRVEACWALHRFTGQEITDALVAAQKDRYPSVRNAAEEALHERRARLAGVEPTARPTKRDWVWTAAEKATVAAWKTTLKQQSNRVERQLNVFRHDNSDLVAEAQQISGAFLATSRELIRFADGIRKKYQRLSPEEVATKRATADVQLAEWEEFLQRPDVVQMSRDQERQTRAAARQRHAIKAARLASVADPIFLRAQTEAVMRLIHEMMSTPAAGKLGAWLQNIRTSDEPELLLVGMGILAVIKTLQAWYPADQDTLRDFVTAHPKVDLQTVLERALAIHFRRMVIETHRFRSPLADSLLEFTDARCTLACLQLLERLEQQLAQPSDSRSQSYFELFGHEFSFRAIPAEPGKSLPISTEEADALIEEIVRPGRRGL